MRRGLLAGLGLVLVGGVATPAVTPVGVDSAAAVPRAAMPFDFDGDGYADLAVGVPGEDLRGKRDAGAVQVLYGSASGVTAHDQIWHQGRKGVKGALEKGDRFGSTLASADFDSDGYADLAIGILDEDIGKKRNTGAVQVLYGSPTGLTAAGDQVWHQGKKGVPGTNELGDRFGRSLAVGDFDGDRFADLAIGIPDEDVGRKNDAGAVVALRGSRSGLTPAGAVKLRQGLNGLPSQPAPHEGFGLDLAAGDVNGDDRDDLVVVVASDADFGDLGVDEQGSGVHVILGSSAGPAPGGSQFFGPEALGFERYSHMEMDPELADFNRDGRDDLAGVWWQDSASENLVMVLHGHPDGLHPAVLEYARPGVDGFIHACQREGGGKLAAADVNGDGLVDLALCWGSPGPFDFIPGGVAGLGFRFVGPYVGMLSDCSDVQTLPLSGGAHDWLIFGCPDASPATVNLGSGMIDVLRITADWGVGPFTHWTQDTPGIKGKAEVDDGFGTLG